MEPYYSEREMEKLNAEFIRDKIVKVINEMPNDSLKSLIITTKTNSVTTLDFIKRDGRLYISTFLKGEGNIGMTKIHRELSNINVFDGFYIEICFRDPLDIAFFWLHPEYIKDYEWDESLPLEW